MTTRTAVWAIDIGQSALKAILLEYAEASGQVVAVAFDYIEHPKILSQPDADADALIRDALRQFLSRNDIRGIPIAIAIPGQAGLSRFVKLPPVEPKRLPEIVRYEARQQIPFPLEDVVWDYQKMGEEGEVQGFALEMEVGLFAMRREQVTRHLAPFLEAGVEVEVVQMNSVALYNCLAYDRLLPGSETPGEALEARDFVVLLDIGADNTNLIATNGRKVWQRNVPIGGNHFTRALTKELKLTFAKAEHLKRNATKAPDPRSVFQAMRPVFHEFTTEVQRSIGYFASVNRDSRIVKIIGMGGGLKLPGLQKFLSQNLQYPVDKLDGFPSLEGTAVTEAPAFQENILSFPVCYGVGLQTLGLAPIRTSLLPPEIAMQRLVRQKKPWFVAAAAVMLAGSTIGFLGPFKSYNSTYENRFGTVEEQAQKLTDQARQYGRDYQLAEQNFNRVRNSAREMVEFVPRRVWWPTVLKAINDSLPQARANSSTKLANELDITERPEIHIHTIRSNYYENLAAWYSEWASSLSQEAKSLLAPEDNAALSGAGWVFTLQGYHFHNSLQNLADSYVSYLQKTLLKSLQSPQSRSAGISHATVVEWKDGEWDMSPTRAGLRAGLATPRSLGQPAGARGGLGQPPQPSPAGGSPESSTTKVPFCTFTIRMVWQPSKVMGGLAGMTNQGDSTAGSASQAPASGPASATAPKNVRRPTARRSAPSAAQ